MAEAEKQADNVYKSTLASSKLYDLRTKYQPVVPDCLKDLKTVALKEVGGPTGAINDVSDLKEIFPMLFGQPKLLCERSDTPLADRVLRVGFVLSGGPASGGHNVVCGLYDALMELNPENVLIAFQRGPRGLFENNHEILTKEKIDAHRNTGGFDMVGTGRDKIETEEQLQGSLKTVNDLNLSGLLVIGGDDSNTNACVVGEYFKQNDADCVVVGIPKTIDGDLQNEEIEISFGFNTATRTYAEMVGNICRDSRSAVKAWHFIKLMGRDASHVTLETALQCQPNVALISEEVKQEGMKLSDITELIADVVAERAEQNRNYGVVLVPEGLLQFIPSIQGLIHALSTELAPEKGNGAKLDAIVDVNKRIAFARDLVSQTHQLTFDMLPVEIQRELISERDPHGNVAVSRIPTELLVIRCVEEELRKRKKAGTYKGKFKAHGHFFGYDGRCGFPSNFDAQYCYNLGRVGALLVLNDMSGYMARVYNLAHSADKWQAGGSPLTSFMNMEVRHGKRKPVIKKALVNVDEEPAMWFFQRNRDEWKVNDCYRFPGPLQYFGPADLCDEPPLILQFRQAEKDKDA